VSDSEDFWLGPLLTLRLKHKSLLRPHSRWSCAQKYPLTAYEAIFDFLPLKI
jgi:hypothetical protein